MMKRVAIVILVLILVSGVAFSQEKKPGFVLNGGAGLYYDATPLPPGAFGFLAALFNLRGEVYISGTYKFTNTFGVGAEAGFGYISATINDTDTFSLIDIPLRVVGSVDLGWITFQPYGGALFLLTSSTSGGTSPTDTYIEAGARIILGSMKGLYLEGGYCFGPVPFYRLGLGLQLTFLGN
jgi:hypothetical protein